MKFWHWLSRRSREERELDEELRFHLEQEAQLHIDRGEAPELARRSARRDFGNVTLTREVTRGMWGWSLLERGVQDLRFAARMLLKNPAFTVVALSALALGIGATTATFSVVNSVLLRPLQFPAPERLVMVWERPPQGKLTNVVQTQNFLDWHARNHSFEGIAAIWATPVNLAGEGEPVQTPGMYVSADFFRVLGVAPLLGRTIQAEDDVHGANCVVVLGYGLWQSRYGGRADVLGRKIRGSASEVAGCEVVGVMPAGFRFPTLRAELYIPIKIDPAQAPLDGRNYYTVARLKPGVSWQAAQAEMQAIAAQTARERPKMNARWSATVVPLMEQTTGESRTTLLVLAGAVGFVLLIACANVANLLLLRASARRREMTVRVALGAGRWRLMHQLVVESLLLAVSAGALGFLLAYWGVPTIIRMLPAGFPLPRMGEISVDHSVLAFTLLVSLACGLFFGILPALQVSRTQISQGLQQGGRTGTASSRRLRDTLVIAEVALALLLVTGAGLLLRSFILLNEVDPGFRPERLLTFRMRLLNRSDGKIFEHRAAVVREVLDRIRALPGVTSASSIHVLPMCCGNSGTGYYRTDRPAPPPGTFSGGDFSVISDAYFRTMGIPMIGGREFDARDRKGAPEVAILNQTAAEQIFPGENPIGKQVKFNGFFNPTLQIVGVAKDIRHSALENAPDPCLFLPQAQQPSGLAALVIRTSGDPRALIPAVKEQIRSVDPNQGAQDIATMEQVMSDAIARPRLQVTLMCIFGLLALSLACVGIYAVISYSVEQRTREMGIRLALGAAPDGIRRLVLREGGVLAAAGIGIGLVAARALTGYLSTLLYTVKPTDSLVFAGVSAVLAAAAMAGCYFPARRATRVDPAVVLRDE
ncbi:MAG TPA: ABC transporter permease [Candidatus Acidoferrales bacterium]|jgi:putative ABC transport system permease protein|nr:ABC transporter permease [Candidatus Acidoferrales bacterium]